MPGRPKEFDPDIALTEAMDVFWRQGYEATPVQDLLDAMGINRGSMYDTFGCKHDLFMKSIRHYASGFADRLEEALERDGSPMANLRALFRGMESALFESEGKCPGCLITNSVMELAHRDAEVAQEIETQFKRWQQAFVRLLDRAAEAGEIHGETPHKKLAAFLVAISHGSVVCAKAGAPRATIRASHDVALQAVTAGHA
jgi:TetR/AcrR family transcriptional repressor of nem operon